MKNIRVFHLKIFQFFEVKLFQFLEVKTFQFLEVKFSIYLNRRVFRNDTVPDKSPFFALTEALLAGARLISQSKHNVIVERTFIKSGGSAQAKKDYQLLAPKEVLNNKVCIS